jgi:hypothetical protein
MKKMPASKANRLSNDDLTIRIGRNAGTGSMWLSNKLGTRDDLHTDLSLAHLGVVALEFEALGDDEAAEFVRGMIERIEKAPASEAFEASYRFPGATPSQES